MSANYFKECLSVLERLHTAYPSFSVGRHLATATSDYGDVWGMTNKEMFHALQKYEMELTLNKSTLKHEEYVQTIIKDAMDMDVLTEEEDEDGNS
jgi:hypothetical protein